MKPKFKVGDKIIAKTNGIDSFLLDNGWITLIPGNVYEIDQISLNNSIIIKYELEFETYERTDELSRTFNIEHFYSLSDLNEQKLRKKLNNP